jgi:DNA-directed RNA polymerase specialized sigma24 family protein
MIEFLAEEDDEMFRLACEEGNVTARRRIVEAYLPFAMTKATRRAKDGERAEDDLFQTAALRILTALDSFKYDKKPGANRPKFTAILQKAIPGALTRYREKDRLIPGCTSSVRGRQLFAHPELAETAEDTDIVQTQAGLLEFNIEHHEEFMNHVESPEDMFIAKEEEREAGRKVADIQEFVRDNFSEEDARAFWIVAAGSKGARPQHKDAYHRVKLAVQRKFERE